MLSSAAPKVLARDDAHIQCSLGDIFVIYTVAEASHANILDLVRQFDRFAATRQQVVCIIVTGNATSPPDGEDRRLVMDLMARHAKKLKGLAIVLRASGFRGSIIRSVSFALFQLPGHGYPVKFFANPLEAVPWVTDQLGCMSAHVREVLRFAGDELGERFD